MLPDDRSLRPLGAPATVFVTLVLVFCLGCLCGALLSEP